MFIESMCNHLSASEDTGKLKLHLDSSKCQLLQPCLFSIYDDILNILHRFIISFAFLAKPFPPVSHPKHRLKLERILDIELKLQHTEEIFSYRRLQNEVKETYFAHSFTSEEHSSRLFLCKLSACDCCFLQSRILTNNR